MARTRASVISIEPSATVPCTVTGPIMALTMAMASMPTPFSRGRVDGSNGPASTARLKLDFS